MFLWFTKTTAMSTVSNTAPNKRLTIILLSALSVLLVPFIAMRFTPEVNWSLFDFIVAGVLLVGTGLLAEFALRRLKTTRQRVLGLSIIGIALLIVWAELAVGIFGSPLAGS